MPELCEVETIKKNLLDTVKNSVIEEVLIFNSSIIKPHSEDFFKKKLSKKTIKNILRKGKYLFFEIENFYLTFHFKMTGHIFLKDFDYKYQKHEHLIFKLSNGKQIIYYDTRRFGKINIFENIKNLKIGIDALNKNLSENFFYEILNKKNINIKTLLLDQKIIAGIGNIYADEILFLSEIHPETMTCKINKQKSAKILKSIQTVLINGIKNEGTSLGSNRSNFSNIFEKHG
ncbi:MAG: hypothetical protein A3F40_04400, partial [Chlamydiae bacterium RIFCSPHIGHO2_12_FULL_27_8]